METLKHDPALFLVIRPNRLEAGTGAMERLLRSLKPAELEAFERTLPDIASSNAGGLWQLARILADGVPKDIRGWDRRRPVLAAFDGTGREEDLSLLFRAFLVDPGNVPSLALHHSISIPATDSRALVESLARLLVGIGCKPRGRASGAAVFALEDSRANPDSGFIALSAGDDSVRVDIVSDESPVRPEKERSAESRCAELADPPDAAASVAPFEELAGSGGDAVVVHLRTRNFFRRNFVRWLGAIAETRQLPNPAEKNSMLAKGSAQLLATYPFMSPAAVGAGADLALGFDLNGEAAVRIAVKDSGGDAHNGVEPRSLSQLPLRPLFDAGWYRAAATKMGAGGVPADQLPDVLEVAYAPALVLANDPERALATLAAVAPEASSSRFPVQLTARPHSQPQRTPGAACMVRAAEAMRAHFEALSELAPTPEEVRSERRLGDLEPALACAAPEPRFAGPSKAIRLARTFVKVDQLAAELRRDEAARALALACAAGASEACARADALRALPKVRLPVLRTCVDFSLPPPGARIVRLGPDGQAHELARLGSSPPVVIEADKDARHDAVLATLERFKDETLVFVFALDQNGKVITLPIPMAPPAPDTPKSAISVLHYPTSREEATLIGPDGARRVIKIADSCPGSPACPLAMALQDLEARESGGPSVVYLDIAGSTPWSETLNVVSNAYSVDSGGSLARSARNITLLPPSFLATRPNYPRRGTN
jgi:hypothetical protein